MAHIGGGGVEEELQESGVFFTGGVIGALGKLRGKEEVVDDEIETVRGDVVYVC